MSFNNEILPNQNTASSTSGHTGRSMNSMYSDNMQSENGSERRLNEKRSAAFNKFIRHYESKFFLVMRGKYGLFCFVYS